MLPKEMGRLPGGDDPKSVDDFLDQLDERTACRRRLRMGLDRRLVSWTKIGSEKWRACVSHEDVPDLRFIREGKTRVKAIENSDKALNDLLRLLKSRAAQMAAGDSLPDSV